MWPFRHKVERPAAGPQPVPAPVIRRDWAGLAPIQRLIGDHPLTAPTDRFSDDLATHHDPSVASDTMGHQVSADAPAGLVLALARPTTRSDGPVMIPRPRVQRREVGAVAESGEWDGDEAASEPARPTPLPADTTAIRARELPVVTPEPAIQHLISLPPEAQPAPVASAPQRSRALPPPVTVSRSTDDTAEPWAPLTPRLTLGQSRRMGLGAPIKRVPGHTVQRAASEVAPNPPSEAERTDQAAPSHPAAAERTAQPAAFPARLQEAKGPMDLAVADRGPSPLTSRPPANLAPSVQLTAAPPPEPSDEPRLDLTLARRPAAQQPSAGEASVASPTLPVQTNATAASEPTSESSRPAPTAVQRLADAVVPPDAVLPTQGSTASRQTSIGITPPTASVQRAASMPSVSEFVPRTTPLPRASASTSAGTAPLVGFRPLRPVLQRSATSPTLPARAEDDQLAEAAPGAARSTTNAAAGVDEGFQPEWIGATAPTLTLPPREREPESQTVREDVPGMAPTVNVQQPGSGHEASTWSRSTSMPLAPSRGIAVQRAVDDGDAEPAETPAPMVQGAWYDSIAAGASSLAANAATSGAAGSAAGSAISAVASSPGAHNGSETDMDELARKLYDRIRTRLKSELLVDRERAGFLTDLR